MFDVPVVAGDDGRTYMDIIRMAMIRRYQLHQYIYTMTHLASTEGRPVFRSLFYNYPEDDEAYKNPEYNFMIGPSVKVTPLYEAKSQVVSPIYFPGKDTWWCPIFASTAVNKKCFPGLSHQTGLLQPLHEHMIHIGSGSIIPMQTMHIHKDDRPSLKLMEKNPMSLGVLTDKNYEASGMVRWDDGETTSMQEYTQVDFKATGSKKGITIEFSTPIDASKRPESAMQTLGEIVIYRASAGNGFGANTVGQIFWNGEQTSIAMVANYQKDEDMLVLTYERNEGNVSLVKMDKIVIENAK